MAIIILNESELVNHLQAWSMSKIVFTNGCFDLFHVGHAHSLKEAKNLGDKLIVGINTDEGIRRLKGVNRPIINEKQRVEMISYMSFVDAIILFDEHTAEKLVRKIKPDILVKGSEYKSQMFPERVFVESYGGRMHFIKMRPGVSTTEIYNKIKNT